MEDIRPRTLSQVRSKSENPAGVSQRLSRRKPEVVFASDAGGSAAGALPCLYSNNSIKESDLEHRLSCVKALCGILSPYHKKQAQTLFANVQRLISLAPTIGHVGFLTLTTEDNCTDPKEFQRRWNSFKTSFLSRSYWFHSYIGVYERQNRGAWHLHLICTLPYDIRSGCDFDQFERRNYRSAPAVLRQLWRDLRQVLPKYGFGRHELLPVRSNPEAMGRYVGKYISKHMGSRVPEDKGKRLVVSSQNWTKNSVKFNWLTEGAKEWRRKTGAFAAILGCTEHSDLYKRLGPNWAYMYADIIFNIDEVVSRIKPGTVTAFRDGMLYDLATGAELF